MTNWPNDNYLGFCHDCSKIKIVLLKLLLFIFEKIIKNIFGHFILIWDDR